MTMPVNKRCFGPTGREKEANVDWRRVAFDSPISAPKEKCADRKCSIRSTFTDDKTGQSDAARRTGEKKSTQDEKRVTDFETEFAVRSEGAHERGHGQKDEGNAHDRSTAESKRTARHLCSFSSSRRTCPRECRRSANRSCSRRRKSFERNFSTRRDHKPSTTLGKRRTVDFSFLDRRFTSSTSVD